MKKAFSLIETMVAVSIILIGFTAVVAVALTSFSNISASKMKIKATAYAEGILEKYRAKRDSAGIASLVLVPTPPNSVLIDGITFYPKVKIWGLNAGAVLVEANVSWIAKSGPTPNVQSYILLSNYNDKTQITGPYIVPSWFLTPTPTQMPTYTLTPTMTVTPTPTFRLGKNEFVVLNSYSGTHCKDVCFNYDPKSECKSVGTDAYASNGEAYVYSKEFGRCNIVSNLDCSYIASNLYDQHVCPEEQIGNGSDSHTADWTNCLCVVNN